MKRSKYLMFILCGLFLCAFIGCSGTSINPQVQEKLKGLGLVYYDLSSIPTNLKFKAEIGKNLDEDFGTLAYGFATDMLKLYKQFRQGLSLENDTLVLNESFKVDDIIALNNTSEKMISWSDKSKSDEFEMSYYANDISLLFKMAEEQFQIVARDKGNEGKNIGDSNVQSSQNELMKVITTLDSEVSGFITAYFE